ncbi:hypothetical protein A0H81_01391 [Grifola frondosa]|uniref:Uncharacterized protein n=1 Tax=Grifola frondosa TaxID=5627 RepID=A0A1C7MS30_GRIFR|nr:hypothetical protein A0H81_01391 [Grifola frondosa]
MSIYCQICKEFPTDFPVHAFKTHRRSCTVQFPDNAQPRRVQGHARRSCCRKASSSRQNIAPVPYEKKAPFMHRRHRAQIRYYASQLCPVSVIAQCMGCTPRTVQDVIKNKKKDNIDSDEEYHETVDALEAHLRGDDEADEMDFDEIASSMVDSMADAKPTKSHRHRHRQSRVMYDSDEEDELEETDTKDFLAFGSKATFEREQQSRSISVPSLCYPEYSEDELEAAAKQDIIHDAIDASQDFASSIPPLSSTRQPTPRPSMSPLTPLSQCSSAQPTPSSPRTVDRLLTPEGFSRAVLSPAPLASRHAFRSSSPSPAPLVIHVFLSNLKKDLSGLDTAFFTFGCRNKDDLDALCLLSPEDDWPIFRDYLQKQHNVPLLHWVIIQAGLHARRAELHAQPSTSTVRPSDQGENECAVYKFLNSLSRPLGRHLLLFYECGLREADDIDALCLVREQWDTMREGMMEKGLNYLEWLVVRDGLNARLTVTT